MTAGNAVLWKPSEHTPKKTADVLHDLFTAAGFPADLVARVGGGRENGPKLAEADVDFVHFTGSDGVSRKLAARLGERLIPSTLELSGVDALIVRADADVALAAQSASSGRPSTPARRAWRRDGCTCMRRWRGGSWTRWTGSCSGEVHRHFASWVPSQISRMISKIPMMTPAHPPFPPQAFAFAQMLPRTARVEADLLPFEETVDQQQDPRDHDDLAGSRQLRHVEAAGLLHPVSFRAHMNRGASSAP